MQGFIASNPLYISALKNDRNFAYTKVIEFTNSDIAEVSISNANIYKVMLQSIRYESNNSIVTFTLSKKKNNQTTKLEVISVDGANSIGTINDNISIASDELLVLSCDDSSVEADYELILFCK